MHSSLVESQSEDIVERMNKNTKQNLDLCLLTITFFFRRLYRRVSLCIKY